MQARVFVEKLRRIQQDKRSDLGLVLAPNLLTMPLPMMSLDDPILPFSKVLIDATRDLVCAYIFDFTAYLATAAAGAVALERAINYARENCIVVMHGGFASGAYAYAMGDNAFNVDAVTVADQTAAQEYLEHSELGVFTARTLPDVLVNEVQIRIFKPSLHDKRGEDFAQRIRAELEKMPYAK